MKIGVTGTRSGMTEAQYNSVLSYLERHLANREPGESMEFHHGDCVGVDVEVAILAKSLGYHVVNHPPIKDELRAFHESDQHRAPLSYFARNRNIVDDTDILLVVPYQSEWQDHGGTWYTNDYAIKRQKSKVIFWPDGTTQINVWDVL